MWGTFVSVSSWKDIKEGIKVKLEFSINGTSASEDRMVFVFAKQWATFYLKYNKINSKKCFLFSMFHRICT